MKRARLLIGDDDECARSAVCGLLDGEFEIVAVVRDGHAALESARAHLPDLVLLDIRMPLLSGVAVARALKKTVPAMRIIFVTVFADEACMRAALRIGVDGYVVKGRMVSDLIPAVRQVLAGGGAFKAKASSRWSQPSLAQR